MIRHPRISGSLIVFAILASLAGCASLAAPDSTGWRTGTVVGLMPRADLPPKVDRDCLGDTGTHDAQRVVVVSFRMSRRIPFYRQAFPLADGETWSTGERVQVQTRACWIKPIDVDAALTGEHKNDDSTT